MDNNTKFIYSTRNSLEYTGKLGDYQVQAKSQYNTYQNFLYNRALYGLSVFSKDELDVMHWEKKKRIKKVNLRAREILNIWKQEISNGIFEKFLKPKFGTGNCTFAQDFIGLYANETDPEIDCKIPFKELGISKKDIIFKLIQENILPNDFMDLVPTHFGLPRLLKLPN